MSEANGSTNKKAESTRTAASKARRTADKATAPASRAAASAAGTADDVASRTASGAARAAEAANGVARSAVKGVEAGRQALVSASGQVAATAKTAWTVVAQRKLVAAGLGGGLAALSAASYTVGRRAGRRAQGPLTRLTGGRL
ncbi:hypothetical protein [Streptomyces sp. NPDC004065]|uniref:hypothetical protein n=1 Tax=Streptomyces sp. NPDC004065 TaxID=3364689 RepID=UPI00384D72D8